MLKFIIISLVQSALLAMGQVFLKLAMARMTAFAWNWEWWRALLLNWQFAATGLFFGSATALWIYILRNYPFSVAYPLSSAAYIFGMIAATIIFKEPIPFTRWIGAALIVMGVFFIVKQ